METIITNGDHWALGVDDTFWPDWFAHGFKKPHLNLAKPETTNQIIFEDTLDEVINPKKHIAAVVVFWTKWKDRDEMILTFKYMKYLKYICKLESIDFIQGVTYMSQTEDAMNFKKTDEYLRFMGDHEKMGLGPYSSLEEIAKGTNDKEGQIQIAKLLNHIAMTRGMFTCY
jgi:hypothetical protein